MCWWQVPQAVWASSSQPSFLRWGVTQQAEAHQIEGLLDAHCLAERLSSQSALP